jgi:hypothetical protein
MADSLAQIIATCSKVQGTVEIRRRGETTWSPASLGAVLREGDWVRTGRQSFARVRFSKKGSIDIEETSSVEISVATDDEAGKDAVVLDVTEGSVVGSIDEETDQAQPIYIAGAKGKARLRPADAGGAAEFRVQRGQRGPEITVRKGRLRVTGRRSSGEISAGQAADLSEGGDLGNVVSLIDFPPSVSPGIDARFRYQNGVRIELEWKPVSKATGYRVQVARDLSFHNLVASEMVDGTTYQFSPQHPGMYVWRAASRDGQGRLGEYGFARRLFCEADPPEDLLVAPPDGKVLAYGKAPPDVVFTWQPSGATAEYRFVVGRDSDPRAKPIIDRVTSEQQVTVRRLREGRYVWGVYTKDAAQTPLFLRPRQLVIERHRAPKANTKDLWD